MILTGVLVNSVVIILCGLIGTHVIKGIPQRYLDIITKATGLAIVFIGISGALKNENVLLLIVSMVVGSILGEWIDIDGWMNKLGLYAEKKMNFGTGTFAKGFVAASILFCSGSMAVVGALNSGLQGDFDMLYAKSILDGVLAVVFSSTMGIGVAFSAIPVLIYEGLMTIGASFLRDFLSEEMVREMSAIGSLIVAAIGLNFLEIKNIKAVNMIPAIFIPCFYYALIGFFS